MEAAAGRSDEAVRRRAKLWMPLGCDRQLGKDPSRKAGFVHFCCQLCFHTGNPKDGESGGYLPSSPTATSFWPDPPGPHSSVHAASVSARVCEQQTHEQTLVAPAAATWGSENEIDFSEK
ncbi:hypothetical protein CB1_000998004 [Camelus ferus]|nr:hypothetical protein CB1_000998004 [Camelus ferus]